MMSFIPSNTVVLDDDFNRLDNEQKEHIKLSQSFLDDVQIDIDGSDKNQNVAIGMNTDMKVVFDIHIL